MDGGGKGKLCSLRRARRWKGWMVTRRGAMVAPLGLQVLSRESSALPPCVSGSLCRTCPEPPAERRGDGRRRGGTRFCLTCGLAADMPAPGGWTKGPPFVGSQRRDTRVAPLRQHVVVGSRRWTRFIESRRPLDCQEALETPRDCWAPLCPSKRGCAHRSDGRTRPHMGPPRGAIPRVCNQAGRA